jgi:hypothetical protein
MIKTKKILLLSCLLGAFTLHSLPKLHAEESTPSKIPAKVGESKAKLKKNPNAPEIAKDLWVSFRFNPIFSYIRGEAKEGPRGRTERVAFREDLDLSPFVSGFMAEVNLRYKDIWTINVEYMSQYSMSPGKKSQKELTQFDKGVFPRSSETRSRLKLEWWRVEAGLVVTGEWYYIEITLGIRYLAYALDIRGPLSRVVARQAAFHFYFPGVVAAIEFIENFWGQIEMRNSFLSAPFGSFVTDGRLAFYWKRSNIKFGVGGQLTILNLGRAKDGLLQQDVNNYSYFELYGLGLYAELGVNF